MQQRTKFQIRSDASKKRWVRDDKKESFWRKHIAEWKASGLSKRAYAISQNLPESSFNAWRREIELRDREKVSTTNAKALLPEDESLFVPLRVLADSTARVSSKPAAATQAAATGTCLDLFLPGGCVLKLTQDSDFTLVKRLIAALEETTC